MKPLKFLRQLMQPSFEEVQRILQYRGYYVSPLGFIRKENNASYVLGEIVRRHEYTRERVIVSYPSSQDANENAKRLSQTEGLLKILEEEKIFYRNRTKASIPDSQYNVLKK